MEAFNLSFEIIKPTEDNCTYNVICNQMDYDGWTKNPQEVVEGLVREWFDLDMGRETPI
jgi:hypothetical protein